MNIICISRVSTKLFRQQSDPHMEKIGNQGTSVSLPFHYEWPFALIQMFGDTF